MLETDAVALESKIKTIFNICLILIIPTIAFATIGYFGIMKPESEDLSAWFQRSGSLIVMLSVIVEFQLFSIHTSLNTSRLAFDQYEALKKKYGRKHLVYSVLTVSVAIIGTVIWGYGDLFR